MCIKVRGQLSARLVISSHKRRANWQADRPKQAIRGDTSRKKIVRLLDTQVAETITFNPAVPEINSQMVRDPKLVKKFFGFKIGAAKNSPHHMLIWKLANTVVLKLSNHWCHELIANTEPAHKSISSDTFSFGQISPIEFYKSFTNRISSIIKNS